MSDETADLEIPADDPRTAEHLLAQGANINFIPEYSEQTALQAAGGTDTQRQILVDWLKERGAAEG